MRPENRGQKLQNRPRQPVKPAAPKKVRPQLALGRANWILLAVGLAVIVAGFISLSSGSITLAPILLVLGYCVLIPLALLIGGRPGAKQADAAAPNPPPATKPEGSGN